MFMQINYLIMKNYLKIASKYDMHKIKYYHSDFSEEILESFDIAEKLYNEARPYWAKVRKYAFDASNIKITTDLGTFESRRYQIISGDPGFNYGKIIDDHLKRLDSKRRRLEQ